MLAAGRKNKPPEPAAVRLSTKRGVMLMFIPLLFMLSLVLYCERRHGTGKPLQDFSRYRIEPAPEWARRGVLYELYVRAFSPEGTFRGAMARLDHLEHLGVDVVWLMPIYPIGQAGRKGSLGSPYSVRDYRAVNPELGSEADFRALVNEIHRRGMKVILDIVPNHSANDHPFMATHPDWFMRDEQGNFTREVPEWSDVTDLNYDNPELRAYMKETLLYWVREFDIDGYRCDVAGMVPLDFWRDALAALKAEKPDIYLLAEWEDPQLLLAGFHSDYDWTLYHLLKDIRHKKNRTAEAVSLVAEKDSLYPRNALPMRFLENHDEERSLSVFGAAGIQAYATFLFTLPGIPLIYAGQEWGELHRPSLFEREPIHWEQADSSLLELYRGLIRMRKTYRCFTEGRYQPLQCTMLSGSAGAFLRADQHTVAVVVTNLKNRPVEHLLITPDAHWKKALQGVTLTSLSDSTDVRAFGNWTFDRLDPFTTLVYVGRR
ncbi:MAG: alpha-amylase [Calditrichaeota bacterium]|nr:MAG: alpha-amylase [Calditrichota bacterium]